METDLPRALYKEEDSGARPHTMEERKGAVLGRYEPFQGRVSMFGICGALVLDLLNVSSVNTVHIVTVIVRNRDVHHDWIHQSYQVVYIGCVVQIQRHAISLHGRYLVHVLIASRECGSMPR